MPSPQHTLPLKPVQHSKRTDQIIRMLQEHRYNRLVDHCRGKTLVNLALKIERLLYRDFPNDANVVLSPELLAMRVNRVIAKVLHLNRTKRHADHSRSYSIASMLNPVDCFE